MATRYPDLEIDLLRAFVAVAETGGFTAASEVVRRSQSAVSQKVLRLEEILGRRLFERTSRSLSLTREGEQLLGMARRMLEFNDIAVRTLIEPLTAGSLRLGISDDFVPRQLPGFLARFRRLYPSVRLELWNGLSRELLDAYDGGHLDVVISKRDSTATQRGRVIWREPLVWLAAAGHMPDPHGPVPLVMLPPPCGYRDVMIEALDSMRRDWFPACTASSLVGIQAAVAGGLGFSVLGRSFLQEGIQVLKPSVAWPTLPTTEIVIVGEDTAPADLVRPLIAFLTERLAGTFEAAA